MGKYKYKLLLVGFFAVTAFFMEIKDLHIQRKEWNADDEKFLKSILINSKDAGSKLLFEKCGLEIIKQKYNSPEEIYRSQTDFIKFLESKAFEEALQKCFQEIPAETLNTR